MYGCDLQIKQPHLAFRTSNEPYMEKMIARKIPGYKEPRSCFPAWFMFYIQPIRDPLTIMHHEDGDVELHPGTNRFIGRSLREDHPWVPSRIISINRKWDKHLSGIRNVNFYSSRNFTYNNKHDFYNNPGLNAWTIGAYAPEPKTWLNMPTEWCEEVLGKWGGRLELYSGQVFSINDKSAKKCTITRRVKDFDGLFSATQFLFKELALHVDYSTIDMSKGI